MGTVVGRVAWGKRTMKVQRKISLAGVSFVALLLSATAVAWADATIRVSLTGERDAKMGVHLDVNTIKAGNVVFVVANDATKTSHEMILVKLKAKGEQLPVDPAKHRINEKQIHLLGEVANLKPGASGQLKVSVGAGDYLLICNIKGHYEAGMAAALTVTD
jgi:uncharacterized cupredoxin-like copper-binding protein